MSIDVAVCQFAAGTDIDENTRACTDLIASAAARGAELAVLPEAAMYFDPRQAAGPPVAQELDGPFASAMAQAAKDHGVAVVVGMSEPIDGEDRHSNTVLAFSATGERTGLYRKVHLYDAFGFRESDTVKPAAIGEPLVVEVNDVRVGVLTCYDLRFGEAFRWVTDAGADVIALPAAWAVGPAKEHHWQTLVTARAIENTCYVAAAGQTGPASCAQSVLVDPMGVTVCCAGEAPGVALGRVDAARVAEVRRVNPSLANRRFRVSAL